MTPAELALLNQIDDDRRTKGMRGREKMRYVGQAYDNEGSDKYSLANDGKRVRPPRNKRKLRGQGL